MLIISQTIVYRILRSATYDFSQLV